jgi:hypothetical protein
MLYPHLLQILALPLNATNVSEAETRRKTKQTSPRKVLVWWLKQDTHWTKAIVQGRNNV